MLLHESPSASPLHPAPFPAVGIRPAIDGRRGGVRESLEDQTLGQARAVAALISSTLRYPDGSPARCVIADSCIGGVREAQQCAETFRRENVGVSLTVTPCWAYGSETMDMEPLTPKAIWGFNGTERPGAVYLAATLAAHAQKGLPAFGIYGEQVQDADDRSIPEDVADKIVEFARAGLAVAFMRGKAYLSMGGVSMGIAGSMVDSGFWERYLGMRVESIDMTEFAGRLRKELYDRHEYERAIAWTRSQCREGEDRNPPEIRRTREELDQDWETSVKMALIARDLMVGNPRLAKMGFGEQAEGRGALVAGFQGQRQWTDHFPNGDFMEAILNSSFDWSGKRAPYLLATENDALNGATMLLSYLLTNSAQIFADVRAYWGPESVERVTGNKLEGRAAGGLLHLINSGPAALDGTGQQTDASGQPAMKPYWEISDEEVQACLEATTWHTSSRGYFPAGGWSTRFQTRGGMPVTISRINLVAGLGPALQLAEGWTVDLPQAVHDSLDQRTDPTWPTTWFAPILTGVGAFASVYEVMNSWGANHCSVACGHVGHRLITLASMLRIPVYMHNVAAERIFRPSSWRAFGTYDPESADFRACQAYGPLYGRI